MSARAKMTFDEKCYELAEFFLEEPAGRWAKEDINELAQAIQRTIEDFIHEEEA